MTFFIWIAAGIGFAVSYRHDRRRALCSLWKSVQSLKSLMPSLFAMVLFTGVLLALIPGDQLARLFAIKGMWGLLIISLMGAIVSIPGPIAFPLAGALLKMGATPEVLASFITTLTMVGIVSSPVESSFFGARFTLLRQTFSFFAAVAIGLIMGVVL